MSEPRRPNFMPLSVKKEALPPAPAPPSPAAEEEVAGEGTVTVMAGTSSSASSHAASLFDRAEAAAAAVRREFPGIAPEIALVLGSGLGAFGDRLGSARYLPYERIPGFPRSTVAGHQGRLAAGWAGGIPVYAMQGRFHYYEGYELEDVTFPIRVFARLGVRLVVLTNAAGGVAETLDAGDLMVMTDHLNLMGRSPLRGPNEERFGPRFPDMTQAYAPRFQQILLETAKKHAAEIGCPVKSGVYAALPGPSYETPAEIRMLRLLGADAVGMSTAPEAIVARHCGLQVCAVSGIANKASGMVEGHTLTHAEVVEVMNRVGRGFGTLIEKALPGLAAAIGNPK